ncbi:hypothetical protein D4764_12G0006330, partial [Takifugu flavidus]
EVNLDPFDEKSSMWKADCRRRYRTRIGFFSGHPYSVNRIYTRKRTETHVQRMKAAPNSSPPVTSQSGLNSRLLLFLIPNLVM